MCHCDIFAYFKDITMAALWWFISKKSATEKPLNIAAKWWFIADWFVQDI